MRKKTLKQLARVIALTCQKVKIANSSAMTALVHETTWWGTRLGCGTVLVETTDFSMNCFVYCLLRRLRLLGVPLLVLHQSLRSHHAVLTLLGITEGQYIFPNALPSHIVLFSIHWYHSWHYYEWRAYSINLLCLIDNTTLNDTVSNSKCCVPLYAAQVRPNYSSCSSPPVVPDSLALLLPTGKTGSWFRSPKFKCHLFPSVSSLYTNVMTLSFVADSHNRLIMLGWSSAQHTMPHFDLEMI